MVNLDGRTTDPTNGGADWFGWLAGWSVGDQLTYGIRLVSGWSPSLCARSASSLPRPPPLPPFPPVLSRALLHIRPSVSFLH